LVAVVAAMAVLTWGRCGVWNSSIALWEDTVRKYPDDYVPIAYFNRGIVYSDMGLHEKAVSDFNKALALYYRERGIERDYNEYCLGILAAGGGPDEVYNFMASKYAEIGKTQEAIGCLNVSKRVRDRQSAPFRMAP
ncbi:MAG: tetratricopeptide repeat protein, partial [bacterium]